MINVVLWFVWHRSITTADFSLVVDLELCLIPLGLLPRQVQTLTGETAVLGVC